MTAGPPPPHSPPDRIGGDATAVALRVAALAAMTISALALIGGQIGRIAGGAILALLIGAPLLRIALLVVHWWRLPDRRFALVALGLLAVVGTGAIAAIFT